MPCRALWDSWAWRTFCPPFLVGKTPASMTSEFQRVEELLIKGEAAMKPPGAEAHPHWDMDHLGPCTDPNLVSSPTLWKLQKKECKTVTALILITHSCLTIAFPYSAGSRGTILEVLAYWGPPLPGKVMGFRGGSAGKESALNAGDLDSIPGLGRSPGEGNSYPLQYSGLDKATLSPP